MGRAAEIPLIIHSNVCQYNSLYAAYLFSNLIYSLDSPAIFAGAWREFYNTAINKENIQGARCVQQRITDELPDPIYAWCGCGLRDAGR